MYANCIFCSADLGRNEAIEEFPVGARLAFDAVKGRLWAVCPACARWNLAPIEERWEPVEQAERLFRDARLRVQSENVGLARLPDGTRLVRVGQAIPGELAAWRYGRQLLRRRRRYIAATGLALAGGAAFYGGLAALGLSTGLALTIGGWLSGRSSDRVIYRVPAEGGDGGDIRVRRREVHRIDLVPDEAGGELALRVRGIGSKRRDGMIWSQPDDVMLHGDAARGLLGRAMVHVNRRGATPATLQEADRILAESGDADRVLRDAAARRATLSDRAAHHARALGGPAALAVEMALNEASERRALEGELAALEAAWREAEEIAAIADSLPGEAALNRLLDRLAR